MCDSNTDKVPRVNDIVDELLRHLTFKDQIVAVSKQFIDLKTNAARVDYAYTLLSGAAMLPSLVVDCKNNELAAKIRQKGNEMFKARKNSEAISLYTQSIAAAEDGSEHLALAYANRSAVLFELRFYQECLMDIDRALANSYPENLKAKLTARQEKANQLKPKQVPSIHHQPIPEIPETQRNKRIPSASASIGLKYTENQGRHVVAKKDISPGEIIVIEKPFCHILIEELYTHCHSCLKLCYNLIPCKNCSQTLYCGEDCRNNDAAFHRYECPILATFRKLGMDKLKLLPLKIALVVRDQYPNINKLSEAEGDLYLSDRYKEIHNLVANTYSRSVADLFKRSVTSAVIFHLVKNFSCFFHSPDEETIFKELVLLHMQTGPCNFHEISESAENEHKIYDGFEIGAGAYSFLSMFNHRCSSNVVRDCHGPVIVVRALESIRKGEQCYDNYGYHHAMMPKSERRAKLKEQYFFDCTCDVCENDWPLYANLPTINTTFRVTIYDVMKLQEGDIVVAKTFIAEALPAVKELEFKKPNRNLAELQETLKQCFALLGNVRKTI